MKSASLMSNCFNCFKWFPVGFIIGVISWSYYAYVFVLCICKLVIFFPFYSEDTINHLFIIIIIIAQINSNNVVKQGRILLVD